MHALYVRGKLHVDVICNKGGPAFFWGRYVSGGTCSYNVEAYSRWVSVWPAVCNG